MCPSRSLHPYFFRTALQDFAATSIFMTSVDTGCVFGLHSPPPSHTHTLIYPLLLFPTILQNARAHTPASSPARIACDHYTAPTGGSTMRSR